MGVKVDRVVAPVKVLAEELETFAFEALSVGGTAVGFTKATYWPSPGRALDAATVANVLVETAPVRVRIVVSGTAPTTTVGDLFQPGDRFKITGRRDIQQFQAISQSGATATLTTHFERPVRAV